MYKPQDNMEDQIMLVQNSLPIPYNTVDHHDEAQKVNKLCELIGNTTDFTSVDGSENAYKIILEAVVVNRLCIREVYELKDGNIMDWLNSLGQICRLILRDSNLQLSMINFIEPIIHVYGQESIRLYFSSVVLGPIEISAVTSFLRSFLSCAQKLCSSEACCIKLSEFSLQQLLICLLSVKDMVIIQATLQLLTKLCESAAVARTDLLAANCIDICLQLLKDADLLSQKLGCGLLRVLCTEDEAREQIKVYDGVPTILGLLCTRNVRLQWHVVWTLAQLAEDEEISSELSQCGALSIILAELGDTRENNVNSLEDWFSMLSGLSAILAQMCQLDSIAVSIVQENGIYIICKPLMAQLDHPEWKNNRTYCLLLCGLFRVLRLIFSLERNRPIFKRIFPADLLSVFIDVGHYNLDIAAYEIVVKKFSEIMEIEGEEFQAQIESANQRRVPAAFIGQYAVIDQLGAGAFGCVYKVKRKSSATSSDKEQFYALKEIFMHQSSLEKEASAPGKSFGDVISEVKIIKQQMRHPNVVRYRKVFVEGEKLYILMDLIDGATLKEHIISMSEKNARFEENRIWNILIQMVLALRYLHKEKKIIHRDLKPNNVMLDDQDKVVITDFGLAKRREESYLKSTAGTVLYSCPEIVQSLQYGEKADIWSLGCILYEMAMLTPPFFSSNMLHLAKAIVDAQYSPIEPQNLYSPALSEVVSGCLTADASARWDVVQVAHAMTSRLLIYIDNMQMIDKRKESGVKNYGSSTVLDNSLNVSGQSWASSTSIFPQTVFNNRTTSSSMSQDSPKCVSPMVAVHKDVLTPKPAIASSNTTITSDISEISAERPTRPKIRRGRDGPMKSAGPSVLPQTRIPRSNSVDSPAQPQRRSRSAVLPAIHTKPQPEKINKKLAWQTEGSFHTPLVLPTIRRTNSTSVIEAQDNFSQPMRVLSAGSLVSVSSAKVKAITDPILELLDVLHKIMFINQLAPLSAGVTTEIDHRRRVLDQFQRNLFAKDSTPTNIKAELRKLSAQSPDPVTTKLGYGDFRPVLQALPFEFTDKSERISSMTYEQLYACMEAVLNEQNSVDTNWLHHRPQSRLFTPAGGGRQDH